MKSVNYLVPALAAFAFAAAGCESRKTEEGREVTIKNEELREVERDAQRDINEAIEKADEKLFESGERKDGGAEARRDAEDLAYGARIDRRISAIDDDIADLRADIDTVDVEARAELREALRDLEVRRADLQRDIDSVGSAADDDLERLKTRIDRAVQDLEDDVERATARLRGGPSRT